MIQHTLVGLALAVEPMVFPDGAEGKQIAIYDLVADNQGNPIPRECWRYPMSDEQAKAVGQQLLGLNDVQVARAITPELITQLKNNGSNNLT